VEKFSAKKNNRKWFTNLNFILLVALTRDQHSHRTLQRHGTTVTTTRTAILAILARPTAIIANTTLTAITAPFHR